jgi:hypothetical protein
VATFSDYIVYADESGDHGLAVVDPSYPIFALTFALVRKDEYVQQIVPAFQKMKMDFFGHDQIVFHERDIRKQLPPFGFLRTDPVLRTRFLNSINRLMTAAPVELFASVIRKNALAAKYASPMNPDEIALLFCMERVCDRLMALGESGKKIFVVFESRGKPEDSALELEFSRIVQNRGNWGYKQPNFKVLEWEAIFVPKAVNSTGLQLADLASRPLGLAVLRPAQQNRAVQVLWPKIKGFKSFP